MAKIDLTGISWRPEDLEFDDEGVIIVTNEALARKLREFKKRVRWIGTQGLNDDTNIICPELNPPPCVPIPKPPNYPGCVNDLCPCGPDDPSDGT